eukprot:4556183-Prymnesium_polylepis.2
MGPGPGAGGPWGVRFYTYLNVNIRHHIPKVEQSILSHRKHNVGFALFAPAALPAVLAYTAAAALLALAAPPA